MNEKWSMQRRQLLKSIGAGGLLSIGVSTVSGRESSGVSATDLDAIHVERGGETVATLQNPSEANVRRLHAEIGPEESLVTPQECCLEQCSSACAYCEYGCCDYIEEC